MPTSKRVGGAPAHATLVDPGVIVTDAVCADSVRVGFSVCSNIMVAVADTVTVTSGAVVRVGRISVGVGGGAEGKGVMTALAGRRQAVSVMTSSTAAPR